jgi:uncharacterized protein YgiM (DUF1202 family)
VLKKIAVEWFILSIAFLLMTGCTETIKGLSYDTSNFFNKMRHASAPSHDGLTEGANSPQNNHNDQQTLQTVKVRADLKSADVRQDPSTHNPPITTLPGGMEVLKIAENDQWVQVRLDMDDGSTLDGWISKSDIVEGSATGGPGQAQSTDNVHAQVERVKVKSYLKLVNVRSDPSTHNSPIATLQGGTEVMKIAEKAGWVHVRLDMKDGSKMDGWISKKLLQTKAQ